MLMCNEKSESAHVQTQKKEILKIVALAVKIQQY